ncbi:hypothetical protein [Clostridium beijerinckii]|nr:hypothetical protein [Clostridium beijerinckii]NRY62089.1 hypothetical protein [Clostridium beijerinckii]
MKMKKLLSMGALGLVIATSTSIGAFAAEKPSDQKVKSDMNALFKSNASPLTYNVDKNTQVSSIINLARFKEVVETYKDKDNGTDKYGNLETALGLINDDDTLVTVGLKLFDKFNEEQLNELISEVRDVADRLKSIENGTNSDRTSVNKYKFEEDMKTVIKGDSNLKLVFGKNKDGKSTVSVMHGYETILQLNSGNAYTLNDFINDNAGSLDDYAQKIKGRLTLGE